eukprot:g2593.t1
MSSDVLAPNHGTITRNIEDLNGLYVRQHLRSIASQQTHGMEIGLGYVHDQTNWLMTMARPKKEDESDSDDSEEEYGNDTKWKWFFVDRNGMKRFSHKGDTIIPGSGDRWSFCRNDTPCEAAPLASEALSKSSVEDALPWQVIALLDADIVHKLRWYYKCHENNIERAIEGVDLSKPEVGSVEYYSLLSDRSQKTERSAWLWRVESEMGVPLYGDYDASRPLACENRRHGSFVLALERKKSWIRIEPLDETEEDELRYGASGIWVRAVDDDGKIQLREVSEHVTASMRAKPFDDPSLRDIFDRPFEPRILGDTLAKSDQKDAHGDDDDDDDDENADDNDNDDTSKHADDIQDLRDAASRIFLAADACPRSIESAINDLREALLDKKSDRSSLLRTHIDIVRGLLRLRRDEKALEAAKAAVAHHETALSLLWFGRCLLRCGESSRGLQTFRKGHALGPSVGLDASRAHRELTKHLRAFKRIQASQRKAQKKYVEGRFVDAASAYTKALESLDNGLRYDKQTRVTMLTSRAACYRRARAFTKAIDDCNAAISIYPRFTRALFRRGACLLESGKPTEALETMERLLRFDRNFPDLIDWLVRITAVIKRSSGRKRTTEQEKSAAASGPASSDTTTEDNVPPLPDADNLYVALGVSTDATAKQLKRAFRMQSLRYHPDRPGGSTIAFQRIRQAYETLSDPDERRMYDAGVDTKKKGREGGDSSEDSDEEEREQSLYEDVERKYFPERYKFHPFGDPLIEKRKRQARARRREAQRNAWGF